MKINVTSITIALSLLLLRSSQAAPLVKQDTTVHSSGDSIGHTTASLSLTRGGQKRLVEGDGGRLLGLGRGKKTPQLKARYPISDLPDPSVVVALRGLLGSGSASSTPDLELMVAHVKDANDLQRRQSFWGMVGPFPEMDPS